MAHDAIRSAFGGLRPGGASRAEAIRELASVSASLERMNRSTEADFMTVSNRLAGFLSVARRVSSEIGAIAQTISGGEEKGDGRAFLAVLAHVRQMERRVNAAGGIAALREPANRIRRGMLGFEQAVPSFRVMAILAQIETARLGSAGLDFGQLAGEIRSSSDNIRNRVDQVLAGAASLEQRIDSAVRDARAFDAKSLKALPSLMASVETGLREFDARQKQSAATAANLAHQFDSVSRAISDVVTSIQVHDITRQQVEHVIEALRLPDGGLPTTAVIDLQIAQLDHASRSFRNAMREMDRRLETISLQVRAMAAESGELLGRADGTEDPFLAQMEACFQTIAEAFSGCRELEERTAAAVGELERTVDGVRAATAEIRLVEMQLRRLALNAGISAAHLGLAGQPLEVVAASMQRLQADCQASSDEADASVRSISEAVASILSSVRAQSQDSRASDGVATRLRGEIDELHRAGERAAGQCKEITSVASSLSVDIQSLRESLSAGTVFASTVERACGALRGIRAASVREHGARASQPLHGLEQRYTMRSEREVHQMTMGAPLQSATPAELGDNVELF